MRKSAPRIMFVCALALALVTSATAPAWAAPAGTIPVAGPNPGSVIPVPLDPGTKAFRTELQKRQARLAAFRAQLDALDRELEMATENYNAASDQLQAVEYNLSMTRADLTAATSALDEQQTLLNTRVDAIYRQGDASAAEIILDSKSVADFVQRVGFVTAISSADADLARQLVAQHEQIASQEASLAAQATQARAVQFTLNAAKVDVEQRIADRQAMLAGAQKDLVAMLNVQATRRSTSESSLWRDIMTGATRAGITVQPYSPVETALSYHGIPYVWAGASPSGFDCSGLLMYVMKQHGVQLPHHAASMARLGQPVALSALQPGDFVFFGAPVHHVGMYIGGGYFVEAPHTGDFVKVSPLSGRNPVSARRYPWVLRTGPPLGVSGVTMPSNLTGTN